EVQRAVSLFSLNDPTLSPDIPPAHSPVHSHLSLERGAPTPRTTPTMRRSRTRWSCSRRWPACGRTTSGCRRSRRPPASSCASSLSFSAGRKRNSEWPRALPRSSVGSWSQ
uniref:Signal induced proliferation associated 1 like 3 n=1 Tax=Chinchilla lanigera TaxID=34839 RepID=A0A8C2W299_CHILA